MSFNSKIIRPAIVLLVITGFILLACKGYVYYDAPNEDGYCAIIMRGDFTGKPQTLPNPTGIWVGLTYLIKDLYTIQPDIDWYSVFTAGGYCLLLFQLAQILPGLFAGLKKICGKWGAVVVLSGSALLFSWNLLLWQFTTMTLLLSSLALFKIWLNLRDTERPRLYKWSSYLFNALCFIYAAVMRSEPAALSLLLWFPLVLLDYSSHQSFKKYVVFLLPLLAVAVISVVINIPFNNTDNNYLAFRKYQFSFFDFKQPSTSLSISNPKDSIIMFAASTGFVSDTAKLNPAFFKRIGMMPMDKTPTAIPYYLRNMAAGPGKIRKACIKLMAACPGVALFYFFFLFAGIFFVYKAAPPKIIRYLFAQLWPIFLFLGITSFMKMENRVLVPMIWCALLQNLVWCAYLAGDKRISGKPATALVILFLLVILPAVKLDITRAGISWKMKRYEELQMDNLVQQINFRNEKIIEVNDNACSKFYLRPFKARYEFRGKKTVCLNYFQLFWLEGYGPYMESVCGKRNIPDIVAALYQRKNEVIFVSKVARMELIESYFKSVYNMDLPFENIEVISSPPGKTNREKNIDANLYRFI